MGLFNFLTKKSKKKPQKENTSINTLQKVPSSCHSDMVMLFMSGMSYADIAKKYGLSRERIRQICAKKLGREKCKEILKAKMAINRDRIKIRDRDKKNKYAKRVGLTPEEYAKGKKEYEAGKKWHPAYEACVDCGTTERPHNSKGRCSTCYGLYLYKTSARRRKQSRESQKKWYNKNKEHCAAYMRKFSKTPKQRAKQKERYWKMKEDPVVYAKHLARKRAYIKERNSRMRIEQPEKYRAMIKKSTEAAKARRHKMKRENPEKYAISLEKQRILGNKRNARIRKDPVLHAEFKRRARISSKKSQEKARLLKNKQNDL